MTVRIASSQQPEATFALQTKEAALLKKSTSSTVLQPNANEVSQASMHQESVHLKSVLTEHDKQVLNFAVGGVELKGVDGMRKLNFMGIRIALDRVHGALSGQLDTTYMNRLAQSQNLTGDRSIAGSSISRAIEFLDRHKGS